MRKTTIMATAFIIAASCGAAMADDDDCYVPMNQWQPRDAVQRMAEARGWTLQRIKTDDGCYEIRGTDENGRAFKAKVNPATLDIIKMKSKDRDRNRDRDRDRDRDHDRDRGDRRNGNRAASPAGTVQPPSNGLFNNGAAPKVEVK